jgi:nucleoid-associated protein YgaU
MARYNKTKVLNNSNDFHKSLREERESKNNLRHYATPRLHNPTVEQRASLKTSTHIWSYGDRLYALADQYYGDPELWWVIAWYNASPTEASLKTGTAIEIPINIEAVLKILGA